MKNLLEAAKLGLQMIEEHGLDQMDGKETHAAKALRRAIQIEEARESTRKLRAMNKKVSRGLADGSLTLDGKPYRGA